MKIDVLVAIYISVIMILFQFKKEVNRKVFSRRFVIRVFSD